LGNAREPGYINGAADLAAVVSPAVSHVKEYRLWIIPRRPKHPKGSVQLSIPKAVKIMRKRISVGIVLTHALFCKEIGIYMGGYPVVQVFLTLLTNSQ
jgi:hypothetical protein